MDKEFIQENQGFKLYIAQDDVGDSNPREWDNLGTMICFHRRYKLGDKHEFRDNTEFMEWWKENGKGGVLLPLALMDHSGLSMWIGSEASPFDPGGWDSGQVGWVYATKEQIIKEYGKNKRKQAEKVLKSEVETYDQYLKGDIWGYIVKDQDGNNVDSCWGFYGYEYCKQEGLSVLQWKVDSYHKEENMAKGYMAL
jgi:hypothetical protein